MAFGELLRSPLACVVFFMAASASAQGYGPWSFGMTREEVRAVAAHGPYYDFKNLDIGTQQGPFEGGVVPTSFYFLNDKVERVMLMLYRGNDSAAAERAWQAAYSHLQKTFGGVELPASGLPAATREDAAEALRASNLLVTKVGKLQMGVSPAPKDRLVWCSLTRNEEGLLMVALNYAKP